MQIINEKLFFQKEHKQKLPYVVDTVRTLENKLHSYIDTTLQSSEQLNNVTMKQSNYPTMQLSIDSRLSDTIDDMARQTILELQRKNVSDYGVLVVDRQTKEIRVLLGGVGYDSPKGGQVNTVFAKNQPGSTMKPFTYALAFKQLGLTPDATILDTPVQYQTALGYAYTPKNFSLDYQGEVTLGFALANSLNVPAIKIADQV